MRPSPGSTSSTSLPLAYMLVATAAFVIAGAGVPWLAMELAGHYYHPHVLALAHVVTLGWVTVTIMGASYQLIPIVLGRPIWSERLARWQLALVVAGVVGMVGHFYIGRWSGLVWGAGLVALGAAAHVANAALSVRGVVRWTFTARLVVLALAGLGLTALFGLLLGAGKLRPVPPVALFPDLHAHVHLALLGWVLPMIIGVAARVYPMFLLAREPEGWAGGLQLWGLAAGVPVVTVGLLAGSRAIVMTGAALVMATVGGHLTWVAGMVWRRKRPALDWGLRFALTGAAFLVPASLLGLALATDLVSGPRAALAYAVLALGGWVSLTIVGMMLKIVPFLVWHRAYSQHVGRAAVPTLAQLGWPAAEAVAYALLTGGVVALALAVYAGEAGPIRAAGGLLAAGTVAFAVTLARVLHHLRPCAARRLTAARPQARAS